LYSPNIFQTTGSLATFHDPDILLLSRHFGSSTQIFKGPRPNNARTSSTKDNNSSNNRYQQDPYLVNYWPAYQSASVSAKIYILYSIPAFKLPTPKTLSSSKPSLAAIDSLKSLYQMASTVVCQKPAVDYFSLATQRPQVSRAAICYNCLSLIAKFRGYSGAPSPLKHTIFQSDQSPV
jgi:hypothetical protein